MKLHTGTDARTGLVHSVSTTAANVSDVTEAHRLLHGGETAVGAMPATRERRSARSTRGRS